MATKAAQVVVTEGSHKSLISLAIRWATGSWWTHAFLVVGLEQGIEAKLPRVAPVDVQERLAELRREDRAYAILDLPSLSSPQRLAIVQQANSYIGRFYDLGQDILFALTGQFWNDGTGTLVCSRLITAAYADGAHQDLFDEATLAQQFVPTHSRLDNLRSGFAIPSDLLQSRLEVVEFVPSSRIRSLAMTA
jgi:uncharacterized protein YycO